MVYIYFEKIKQKWCAEEPADHCDCRTMGRIARCPRAGT